MKILVIHASAGAGHFKAAEAIFQGLKKYTPHEVFLIDALDLTSPGFKKMYGGGYQFLVTKLAFIWKLFFGLLNIFFLQPIIAFFRRLYNAINTRPLHAYLIKENFDCIISTQFLSTEVAAALKRKGKIRSRLITVVTDYDVHRIWLQREVDHYAVACDYTEKKMRQLGVDEKRVHVTGIPTDAKFLGPHDVQRIKENLGLDKEAFTVLIATGSFGIGPIKEIVQALEDDFQVLAVCGHNKKLCNELSQEKKRLVKVFGLVNNMPELMAVADAMVTKPGGLSISEALVSQLPLIFFNPIPGQEEGNIRVLKAHGIGDAPKTIDGIVQRLRELKSNPAEYRNVAKNTKNLARPNAVQDIISLITI